MLDALKKLLGSSKLWMAVIGSAIVTLLAATLPSLGLSADMVHQVLLSVAGFFGIGIGGIGLADMGKEKAKLEAQASKE